MDEAESLIRKANTIEATGVLDGNEAGLLHHEFSVLLFRLDRFDEGLREEEKALELLNKAENADCQLTVLVLKQLAVYMTLEKQFQAANSLLEGAIRIVLSASTIGKDSLLHGQVLATQAILRINEHKFEEARQLQEHAIMLIELHKGQFNPKLADLYKIFAKHMAAAGQEAEAEQFLNRARLVSEHKKLTTKIW
ncbi:MAG: hypothetical protein K2X93_22675 [Candidatus Obscuribacterales bacterium]|nr:hypothetical protein [Candidatus Obscuribacterales bacterium]